MASRVEWAIEWLGLYGKEWVDGAVLFHLAGKYPYVGEAERNGYIERQPNYQPTAYRLTDKAIYEMKKGLENGDNTGNKT